MKSTSLANLSILAVTFLAAASAANCGKGGPDYPSKSTQSSGGSGGTAGAGGGTTSSTGGAPGTCTDGAMNQSESDVDCGGTCPTKCADGKQCNGDADCNSGHCDATKKVCSPSACHNQMKDGNETDVDCGGDACAPCADTKQCAADGDCASGYCDTAATPAVCTAPSCMDAVKNGTETDVDCGGSECNPCDDGKACEVASDCASQVCAGSTNTCAAPACDDGVLNADESDIDCGGGCPGCGMGKTCAADSDCASDVCSMNKCVDGSCADLVQNGSETDVDCGGNGSCLPCADTKACLVGSDCASGVCKANKCIAPSCSDQVKNGMETDVDCGGPCPNKCGDDKLCSVDADCVGGYCAMSSNPPVCKSPACNDGVKNGTESDLDCGASCPNKCAAGQACNANNDCTSLNCQNHQCIPPTCTDGIKNGSESDLDCGGPGICKRCELTQTCTTGSDCTSGTCTGGLCVCPPGMVTSPKLGGGAFCIDQKEVTYAQYTAFYTANPPTGNQSAQCLWNTSYTPSGDWPGLPGREQEPVRYVNWCQAEAYCKYNKRRLCGGLDGNASPQTSFNDPNVSQWFSACSGQGVSAYPYGPSFQSDYCVSALKPVDGGVQAPDLTGKYPTCQGGTPSLLDMSGNVAEWEDSCNATTGKNDNCLARGGSWESSTSDTLRCDSGGTAVQHARSYAGADVGFRCCL